MSVGHRACSAVSFLWCVPMEALPSSLSVEGARQGQEGRVLVPECVPSEVFTNISSGVQRQSSFQRKQLGEVNCVCLTANGHFHTPLSLEALLSRGIFRPGGAAVSHLPWPACCAKPG